MKSWPLRLWNSFMTVCKTNVCVLAAGWLIWNNTFYRVQKLRSNTWLPQVSPWLGGVYWISLERLRDAFRKRVNSLLWGKKKCNRKTEKHSQGERKEKESILHMLTEVCNSTKPDMYTHTRKECGVTERTQHKETTGNAWLHWEIPSIIANHLLFIASALPVPKHHFKLHLLL